MAYKISPDLCVACGTCIDECPVEAISAGDVYVIDPDKCIDCGTCAAFARAKRSSPNNFTRRHKKLFPRKEELFYCLFPSGSADTPETRGRSTHTACRRSGIHNSFPADFNGRSRFRRPLIRYAPKHPRKGFRGKVEIHRTIAAGPCITGHRKTRVQGFCRKRTFPFAESIYYT